MAIVYFENIYGEFETVCIPVLFAEDEWQRAGTYWLIPGMFDDDCGV